MSAIRPDSIVPSMLKGPVSRFKSRTQYGYPAISTPFPIAVYIPQTSIMPAMFRGPASMLRSRTQYSVPFHNFALTAQAGVYGITSQNNLENLAVHASVTAGSYGITGAAATLIRGRNISTLAGSYALTGDPATLLTTAKAVIPYIPQTNLHPAYHRGPAVYYKSRTQYGVTRPPGSLTLSVDAGIYALVGNNIPLLGIPLYFTRTALLPWLQRGPMSRLKSRTQFARKSTTPVLTATAGSYAITGATAGIGRSLTAGMGVYAVQGADSVINKALLYNTIAGVYTVTGFAASRNNAVFMSAVAGTYTLSGATTGLQIGKALLAAAGAYAITGNLITVARTWNLAAIAGRYTLVGMTANAISGYNAYYHGRLRRKRWVTRIRRKRKGH